MEVFVKKSTSFVLLLSPAFFFCFFCLLWIYALKPLLKNWVLELIPQINSAQPYVDISVQNIDLSLLKLQAKAENIEITFKKDAPENLRHLSSFQIGNVKAQLDLFSLVVGQLSLSSLTIDHMSSTQELSELLGLDNSKDNKNTEINLKPILQILDDLPIQKLILQNSELITRLSAKNHPTLRELRFLIKNLIFSLNRKSISIQTENLETIITNQMKASVAVSVSLKAHLDEEKISFDQLRANYGQSEINLTTTARNLKSLFLKPQTNSKFSVHLKLDEIKDLVYLFKEQSQRLPQLSGLIYMKGQVSTEDFKKNSGSVEFATEEVRFENLKFGNAKAVTQIKDNHFMIDSILAEHPAGRVEFKHISIQQERPYSFKTDIVVDNFQLQKLFSSLNLSKIPADLYASATAKCQGQIENFEAHCDTDILAKKISVQSHFNDPYYIIQIDHAKVTGSADINLTSIKFISDLQIDKSKAHAIGEVRFQNGFDMKLDSNYFDLNEIQNIASLGLKGIASGTLTTSGTTDHGVIDSKLQINQLGIDHFYLGDAQFNLKYAKSKLSFQNALAKLNKTNYEGNVELDFSKSELAGQFQLKPLFLEDILISIKERWHLPIAAAGAGHGQIQFSGPLDFWKMKYQLKSEFQRGHIMNENFTKLSADLNADGDKINFKNFVLQKSNGQIRILNDIEIQHRGQTPRFNLQIKSTQLKLEDIDHFSNLFSTANGYLLINGTVTSDISNPLVQLQLQTKDLKIDNLSMPTSQGEVKLTQSDLRFQGQIFGRQLQLDFKIPFKDSEKFYLKAQARDFNPLSLLPMINLPLPSGDTMASVTANIDLKSDMASVKNLNGTVLIDNAILQRSTQILKLKQPATIFFEHGLSKMNPIELSGSYQNLKISLRNGSKSDLQIDGRIFLRPLQFLIPFADNLSGVAELSCQINLKSETLNLSGEGLIDDASISLKGFKYPINDLTAYFDFTKSKIVFSELSATLNQSPLSGAGQIDIKGPKNIDVKFTALTEKIDLEFPNQYQTSGTAQVQFFGSWLPYHLKINYVIDEGRITKEFDEGDSAAISSLRPSPFLPAQQLSQKNQSLILDVTADFSKGIVIKNRILEGIATGQVHVSGSPENPILQGRIDIQPGSRLIFKDKPFDIQLGTVNFNGDYAINPTVYINANARVSDYDINLIIQGPGKNLDIRPTSQPNLSREDIFSLLALGYTNSKNDQTLSSDAQQKQTGLEVLAALSNQSQLNKKLQEKLGLNVQLSPSIDSTRNIAVPKVVVSKKMSQKIMTSYSRPLTGDQQENEVRLQYLWTKNWSLILNYQNLNSNQQSNILQNNKNETGVGGIDFEFKKEFGE